MKKKPYTLFRILLTFTLATALLVVAANFQSLVKNPVSANAQSVHDVAVKFVSASKTSAVKGELVIIYVTAENQGDYAETFDVSAFANSFPVSMPQTVTLAAKATQNLTFTWDTSSFQEGDYAVKATASTVPFEVDITDNTLIDGIVSVRLSAIAGSSGFYLSTNLPFQRKAFHAAGLHWLFYSDYGKMVYKTSPDGIFWSPPTIVRNALYGYLFSVWFDGTYVHYAHRDVSGILHRRGLVSANGIITWGTEHEVVYGNFWVPSICVDSTGFPWITYRTNSIGIPSDAKPYVVKATVQDGSSWGISKQLSALDELWWTVPLPLTSGKVYVLFSYPKGPIYGNLWNGTSWFITPETATEPGSTTEEFGSFSSVAKGDNVFIVYLQNFTRKIVAVNRTNTWGQETTIATDNNPPIFPEPPNPLPTISVDPSKGTLYVRWIAYDDRYYGLVVKQIKYDTTRKTWSNIETPFGTIFNSPDPRSLSSYYQVWDSLVASTWAEGVEAPYSITYSFQQV